MKKTLLFLSALFTGTMTFAQTPVTIPNAGFEDWVASGLDKWSDTVTTVTTASLNGTYFMGPTTAHFNTADTVILSPYTGTSSVVMHSNSTVTALGTINVPGAIVSGENAIFKVTTNVNVVGGIPSYTSPSIYIQGQIPFANTKSPSGLKGYYKYKSDTAANKGNISIILFKAGDTVAGYADLTKLSAATNLADSADALVYPLAQTNTWTAFSFNFTANITGGYTTIPATIDSARIVAMTVTPGQLFARKSGPTDSLFLDKLEFIYTATAIESVDGSGFGVSQNAPNPTNGETTIEVVTPNAGTITLTVVDILGTVVSEQTIAAAAGSNTITYDGSTTPSGTYFYTVSNGASSVTKKLVVAK